MPTNYNNFMLTVLSFITILALMHKISTDILFQTYRMNNYAFMYKN